MLHQNYGWQCLIRLLIHPLQLRPSHLMLIGFSSLMLATCSSSSSTSSQRSNPPMCTSTVNDEGCASYTVSGQTFSGVQRETDGVSMCLYVPGFTPANRAINCSIQLSNQVDRHIFNGSLRIGVNADSQEELTGLKLVQGGDGPTLTIDPGVTVAFRNNQDFLLINRGAQLMANGTKEQPIGLTSVNDNALGGGAMVDANQLWGGLVINGFGVTNACSYIGERGSEGFSFANSAGCHVISEGLSQGQVSHYGGLNDADNSGTITYLIVKHAGAEVAPNSELNGVTFNAVGSATTVNNLQVYYTYDDGIEFFGGAVNVSNYLALYSDDDSIDIDAGYRGTIENALIIQSETNGNRCIEADGVASYSGASTQLIAQRIAAGLNSRPILRSITCIMSANDGPEEGHITVAGTHDPGEGLRLREGLHGEIDGLVVTNGYTAASSLLTGADNNPSDNWCLDIDSPETLTAAADSQLTISNSIFACSSLISTDGDMIGGQSELAWLTAGSNIYSAPLSPLINPGQATNPELALFLENSFQPLTNRDLRVPGHTPPLSFTGDRQPGFRAGGSDWTAGWTLGLTELWFLTTP